MTRLVGPRGPWDARIMAVGEAPGANEERLGQPFVGGAGQLLEGELMAAGIPPSSVFFTNLCQERPPKNDLSAWFNDAGQPNDTVLRGLAELRSQIERVKPNVIIPLGNFPLKFLTGKGRWSKKDHAYTGIGDYRGSILEGSPFAGGAKCVPSYHPAAVLRSIPLKPILRLDLQRAALQSKFPEIRRPAKLRVIDPQEPDRSLWASWLISPPGTPSPAFSLDDGQELRTVPSASFLTSDIEYIGSQLLCVGFTRHHDVAVTFRTRSAADIDFVRGILLSGIPLCFQNGMFDGSILEWFYNIECMKYIQHDTMYAMHSAYIELQKDLGFIGSIYTELPVWWDHINWDNIKAGKQPIEDVLPYNCDDVWVTHDAMEQLLADELQDPDVYRTYRHEMALVLPLWRMSKRGVPFDPERRDALQKVLEEEAATLEAGLHKVNGAPVNTRSRQQVAKLLYEKLGVPQLGAKTPTGQWKMDDTTLAMLYLNSPTSLQKNVIKMIRGATKRRDLISKFCNIELDADGRMRCHYDAGKTDTGRLASREFYPTKKGSNLQNQSRDVRVRRCYVSEKGKLFGYADLKSAESLVVAHITGDKEMLRLHSPEYMSGKLDGHKYVAAWLLEKKQEDITKEERDLGKEIRHSGNYMRGPDKLMARVNKREQETGVAITLDQARIFSTKYIQLHPGLPNWWDDVATELRENHKLYTLLRRKRDFLDRPENCLPEAVAYVPQGTIGDVTNIGLLRMSPETFEPKSWGQQYAYAEELYKDYADVAGTLTELGFEMLLQVHDAIGFQVPEKNIDAVIPLIQRAMSVEIPINRKGVEPYKITIPVEIQVGYNWGEYNSKKPELNPDGLKPYVHAA